MLASSKRAASKDLRRNGGVGGPRPTTPRRPSGSSWVCNSLQSSVFAEASTPHGGGAERPAAAAGVPRGRAVSAESSANHFYGDARPARPVAENQVGVMANILFPAPRVRKSAASCAGVASFPGTAGRERREPSADGAPSRAAPSPSGWAGPGHVPAVVFGGAGGAPAPRGASTPRAASPWSRKGPASRNQSRRDAGEGAHSLLTARGGAAAVPDTWGVVEPRPLLGNTGDEHARVFPPPPPPPAAAPHPSTTPAPFARSTDPAWVADASRAAPAGSKILTPGRAPRRTDGGKGFGACRPSSASPPPRSPAAARPPSAETGEWAGLGSARLHNKRRSAGAISRYASDGALDRRAHGVSEGRAGTGPSLPPEQRVCGLSRRPPRATGPSPRNPILAEGGLRSPDPSHTGRMHFHTSRLHADSASAAVDHLDCALVPQGPDAVDAAPPVLAHTVSYSARYGRGQAEAHTGLYRAEGPRPSMEVGCVPTSGEADAANGWTGKASYGKRHVYCGPADSVREGIAHPGSLDPAHFPRHEPSSAVGTPRPTMARRPSSAGDATPAHSRPASSHVRAEAVGSAAANKRRGSTSHIFSDLAYPSNAAAAVAP